MNSIKLNNIEYVMVDTLLVKEMRKINMSLAQFSELSPLLKEAKEDEILEFSNRMNKLTIEDFNFALLCIKRCYKIGEKDMTEDDLDNLHAADTLFLFSELLRESKTLKKKPSQTSDSVLDTPQIQTS